MGYHVGCQTNKKNEPTKQTSKKDSIQMSTIQNLFYFKILILQKKKKIKRRFLWTISFLMALIGIIVFVIGFAESKPTATKELTPYWALAVCGCINTAIFLCFVLRDHYHRMSFGFFVLALLNIGFAGAVCYKESLSFGGFRN